MYELNQPKEQEVEYSAVWPLAGEWWVNYESGDYISGYTPLFTYNTAGEDTDKLWISDNGNWWTYTVKSGCSVDAKTFSGTNLVSTADGGDAVYDIEVQITNGKVIVDGGKSTSGVVCDSIYFEVEFEDDPGTVYQCSGVRRTGFLEDEH